MGLRYRVHVAPLSGLRREADIVFTRGELPCSWMAVSGTAALYTAGGVTT